MEYEYEWQGIGLLITTPAGTRFLQGDEASELYDELETIESDELLASVLSEYESVCEPDDESEDEYEIEADDARLEPCGPLGGMTRAVWLGRSVGEFAEEDDAEAEIRRLGNRDKFYPSVWRISDHGNAHLITDWTW